MYSHVITKFSGMGRLDLLTNGAPQSRFARQSSAIILLQDFIINFLRNIFTSVAPQIAIASLGGYRKGYKQKILQLN